MRRNRGFTIVEFLLSVAIATLVGLGIAEVLRSTAKIQTDAISLTQIDIFRRDLVRLLTGRTAWLATTAGNSSMTCLTAHSDCTTEERAFTVYENPTTIFYDGTSANTGLNSQGKVCNGYSPSGSDECPFRYDLKWKAICTPTSCVDPLIKVTATLAYQPRNKGSLVNANNYNLVLYLAPSTTASSMSCGPLAHTANGKSFTVSWSSGAGVGTCGIQYQKNDGTWAAVAVPASIDCNDSGAAVGPVLLPGDGWLGGNWSAPVPIRLVRTSDGAVMCSLGALTCSNLPGSPTPTPTVDEDCNNQWDNSLMANPACGMFMSGPPTGSPIPGQPYTCPATFDASDGCGARGFSSIEFGITSFHYVEFYSDATCTTPITPPAGYETEPDPIYACKRYGSWLNNSLSSASGATPNQTSYINGPFSGYVDITGGCTAFTRSWPPQCSAQTGYMKLNSPPGQWSSAPSCLYGSVGTTTYF